MAPMRKRGKGAEDPQEEGRGGDGSREKGRGGGRGCPG